MYVAALVNADVFVDGSGASALVRVGSALFACSASEWRAVLPLARSLASLNQEVQP